MAGRGEMDAALAVLDGLLKDEPKNVGGMAPEGRHLSVGKRDTAGGVRLTSKHCRLQPRYAAAHTSLITVALQRGDMAAFKAAVDDMSKALPGHPDTLLYEAQSALADKKFAVRATSCRNCCRPPPKTPWFCRPLEPWSLKPAHWPRPRGT
jgi:hypothetical protein